MLQERLREDWQTRVRVATISPTMIFAPEGLVLGAGTVLLPTDGARRLQNMHGSETRVLALLSAFNGKPTAPSVLRNIERATKAWCESDICLVYIHLAHARLRQPQDLRLGAYRLEMADCAMRYGAPPRAVFKALSLDERYVDALEKVYNPAEPRVSAGSGRTSGEWTSGGDQTGGNVAGAGAASVASQGSSLGGTVALPASSFLADLDAGQVAELGAFASRFLSLGPIGTAAVAVFGLLFLPSSKNIRVEGEIPEIPGLRYSWDRDETLLHLTYDGSDDSQRIFSAQLDGDVFRDAQGRVIGRVLSSGNVAIDVAAVSPDLVDEDEPRLCPLPVKDKRTNDFGLDYENYIKSIVNPENPTPPFMGYALPNIVKTVTFDDCEHSTGPMVEVKDGYAGFLASDWGRGFLAVIFLEQAEDQIQAAGTRSVRWYFSQKGRGGLCWWDIRKSRSQH